MTSMTVAETGLPFGRPLVRADLRTLPDDGHRYELIDGTLIVTPTPWFSHQQVLGKLLLLLHGACPDGVEVLPGPFAVALADDTELQPDAVVAPVAQFTEEELVGAPLLAVEVLSPSTRRVDLLLKRDRLQAAGCPSYWLVDPEEPSVTVLQLDDGAYTEVGTARADEQLRVTRPFPVTLVPAEWRGR